MGFTSRQEVLVVESIEDAVGVLNDSVDRTVAGKEAEERASRTSPALQMPPTMAALGC